MEQCVDLWRPIRKWAKTVQNTEPEVLVGGITYHRQDDGVVFSIPVQSEVYPDFKTKVLLVVSDSGKIYYPIRRYSELYHNFKMFKHFFEDGYIDSVVIERPVVSFVFYAGLYSPELQIYPNIIVSIDLNFLTQEFSIEIGLKDNDWNRQMLGIRLSKLIAKPDKEDDTDDAEA